MHESHFENLRGLATLRPMILEHRVRNADIDDSDLAGEGRRRRIFEAELSSDKRCREISLHHDGIVRVDWQARVTILTAGQIDGHCPSGCSIDGVDDGWKRFAN